MFVDRLENVRDATDGTHPDPTYLLDEIKKISNKFYELHSNCYLAIVREDILVRAALFQFCSSNCDDTNCKVELIFECAGPSSNLRECRHSYWGPDRKGYLYYLPAKAIVQAINILSEYFDFD